MKHCVSCKNIDSGDNKHVLSVCPILGVPICYSCKWTEKFWM